MCPAWACPGGAVRIALAGGDREVACCLQPTGGRGPILLRASARSAAQGDCAWYTLSLPKDLAPGLYGLRCQAGDAAVEMPRCLAVPREDQQSFSFAHMSDPHLLKAADGWLRNRADVFHESIRAVNRLRPDFVIHTGDLITRYDGEKRLVSDELIADQMRQAREALAELEPPLFLSPGNHDTGLPAGRAAWARLMGRPLARQTDDFSFRFGQYVFMVMESIQEYDGRTGQTVQTGPTSAQRQWLTQELASAADGKRRFLFTHYDYTGELAEFIRMLPIDAVFYGHAAKPCFPPSPVVESHLVDRYCYRLVTVRNGQITGRLGPTYEDLMRGTGT